MDYDMVKHIQQKTSNEDALFRVVEFSGDYPIENQKYWDAEFPTLEAAKVAAQEVYDADLPRYEEGNFCACVMKGTDDKPVAQIGINRELDAMDAEGE